MINIAHVGILCLHIADDHLQKGVLIEIQETRIDGRIIDLAKLKHVLEQCARFYRIIGVHLLQRGKVACGQITAFQAVVALHMHLPHLIALLTWLEAELASHTGNSHHKSEKIEERR